MPQSNQPLFVSHVSEDHAAAMTIVAELERNGVCCWVAPRDVHPGKPFDDEIAAAIENCRAMLLIFSERCNEKDYIRREVTVAGKFGKDIIPLRIENVQPRRALEMRLSDLHWIDAFESREPAIAELARMFAPPPTTAAAPSERAPVREERPAPPPRIRAETTYPAQWNRRTFLIVGAVAFVIVVGLAALLIRTPGEHNAIAPSQTELATKERRDAVTIKPTEPENKAAADRRAPVTTSEPPIAAKEPAPQKIAPVITAPVSPPATIEQRARDFALSMQSKWSKPNAEALAGLEDIYTDEVVYEGKKTKKDAIIKDKQAFVQRWPEREYKPKESISVSCGGNICTVRGIVDFRAIDPVAKIVSAGMATFEYQLVLSGAAIRISMEGGQVLTRTRTPFSGTGAAH